MMSYFRIVGFICACILQAQVTNAQYGYISTIAGTDSMGYNGDNIVATTARLKAPNRIVQGPDGNIYISDALNHRIRKIDAMTGIISTVAGTGVAGFFGDGGLAINAQLNIPHGIAFDVNNNMYIADADNNRIRKVDAGTGIITTIVGTGVGGFFGDGGLAINAQIFKPVGLAIDKYSNMYIADYYNNRVRQVNLSSKVIVTYAGNGSIGSSGNGGLAVNATFNGIISVACDSSCNVYIGDQVHGNVRKVDYATSIITTIAGTTVSGYGGDGNVATNANLDQPAGLFFDKNQNLFVADYWNGAIRKIDAATKIISTVAGTGVKGFSGDGGPATSAKLFCTDVFIDKDGNMVIADYENNRIRKVMYNTSTIDPQQKDVNIFPNPTSGKFTIEFNDNNDYTVEVFNIVGQRVFQSIINSKSEIDLSKEAAGVYFVQIISENGSKQAVKVLKQ